MTGLRPATLARATRAAAALLTSVPIGGFPFDRKEWSWAPAMFPLVGGVIGLVLWGVWSFMAGPVGPLGAAAVTVVVGVMLTGAFHEDGLADTADALGGAHNRDRLLDIMKDPRVGTYGATALVASILLRTVFLADTPPYALGALIMTHSLGRAVPVALMACLPYVTDPDVSRSSNVARVHTGQLVVCLGIALTVVLGLARVRLIPGSMAATVLIVATAVGALTYFVYRRRVGGVTGDLLGGSEQLTEIAVLGTVAWLG